LQKAIGIKHHNLITNHAAIVTPNDFALLQEHAGDNYQTL
jgi:serine/threonine protein kinase